MSCWMMCVFDGCPWSASTEVALGKHERCTDHVTDIEQLRKEKVQV